MQSTIKPQGEGYSNEQNGAAVEPQRAYQIEKVEGEQDLSIRINDVPVGTMTDRRIYDPEVGSIYRWHAVFSTIGDHRLAQGFGKTNHDAIVNAVTRSREEARRYQSGLNVLEQQLGLANANPLPQQFEVIDQEIQKAHTIIEIAADADDKAAIDKVMTQAGDLQQLLIGWQMNGDQLFTDIDDKGATFDAWNDDNEESEE